MVRAGIVVLFLLALYSCSNRRFVDRLPASLYQNNLGYVFVTHQDTIEVYSTHKGVYDGTYKMYVQGHIFIQGQYKHGKKHNTWQFIDRNGNATREVDYKNGEEISSSMPNMVW